MAYKKVVKVGRIVETLKGDKVGGPFAAKVVSGPGFWRTYKSWMVQKNDGQVVRCLDKNLVVVG
jgi:hypothetical protein